MVLAAPVPSWMPLVYEKLCVPLAAAASSLALIAGAVVITSEIPGRNTEVVEAAVLADYFRNPTR